MNNYRERESYGRNGCYDIYRLCTNKLRTLLLKFA